MRHVFEGGEFDPQGDVIGSQTKRPGERHLGVLGPIQELFLAPHLLAVVQLYLQLVQIAQTQTRPRVDPERIDRHVHQEEINATHEILQFEVVIAQQVVDRLDPIREFYGCWDLVRFT